MIPTRERLHLVVLMISRDNVIDDGTSRRYTKSHAVPMKTEYEWSICTSFWLICFDYETWLNRNILLWNVNILTGDILIAISSRVFRYMYNKWEKETLSYKQENIFRNLYCLWNLSALFLHIFLSWKPFFLSDIDTDIETQIEIKYYTNEGRHDFQPCVSDGKFPWHSRSFKNYRFEDNKIEITPSWDSYTCIWQKHFINEKKKI